ncbi:diguanylate cyclase [Roseiconus nitratireducens]|uniref:diguanylate cyclase n=1 Tax=Roseiconus nitratireducens TaxID=2605748 RepID=A0A5M6DEU7_9BACT|nr:diguanylate cyclase [Roseiconus nitratireducens]KAA5545913.1 diguanylate cyclase [Roseiconus nitratireducens]
MARVYFQSLRLAIALVCLGASLILASHWFGLLPDVAAIQKDSRRRLSEAMAVNAAAHVRKNQWLDLRYASQTVVDRDGDLLSVGIRNNYGDLKVDAGHHAELWERAQKDGEGMDPVKVPITLNRRPWGYVELCFRAADQSWAGAIIEHPLLRQLAFFCILGTFGYTLFVGKVMKVFNTTQVVPERVRQALDTLAEGLLVLDEKARIVLANRAFADTVNVPGNVLVESCANDLPWTHPDSTPCTDFPWMSAIDESATLTEHILHLQIDQSNRRIFSVNAAPLGSGRVRRGALATFRDVTHIEEHRAELETMLSLLRSSRDEIEQKNKKLEILATQDALTGCLNRRAFFERFGRLWKREANAPSTLACIMIDNDHFKKVNDTYGHSVGDDVLREVARVLKQHHKDQGLVCRYGGEEFCVLLPGVDLPGAMQIAEATREAITEIRFDDPEELRLTASLGVSELRFGATDPQELINQADVALYAAKRAGRNCVMAFCERLAQSADELAEHNNRKGHEIPYQAVTALVSALSFRDPNTAEHSRRVADLCIRVATPLMDPLELYVMEIAALLHDVGKIGVPDEILLKPGELTEDEWKIMSRNDRIGIEIIESAFECEELTQLVQACHKQFRDQERYDDNLHGSQIPLGGRLLAICDSYDSMISDRVYRAGRSHDDAIAELRRCAGTQFDPELVEHFAQIVTRKPHEDGFINRNETAIQIGFQVERLATAVDEQDTDSLRTLSARLELYARSCNIVPIAQAADRIHHHASQTDIAWFDLLRDTNELLDLCRSTQSEILRQSLGQTQELARLEVEF